nr:hypothetical protein Iba_chr03aCG16110 [Ipomoea batatas]
MAAATLGYREFSIAAVGGRSRERDEGVTPEVVAAARPPLTAASREWCPVFASHVAGTSPSSKQSLAVGDQRLSPPTTIAAANTDGGGETTPAATMRQRGEGCCPVFLCPFNGPKYTPRELAQEESLLVEIEPEFSRNSSPQRKLTCHLSYPIGLKCHPLM